MKPVFTICFLFMATWLSAQQVYDIIYLKDGSFYQGNITEYIPEDHAIIKLLDGRIISLKAEDIRSLNVSHTSIIKKNFDIKSKGYYHNSLVGPQFGSNQYSQTEMTFAYNMVNGYKINSHHAGLGLGIENHVGNWYAPIYIDYSYHILSEHFRPMVGINGGFLVPLQNDQFRSSNYRYDYEKGSFIGGRIGFAVYSGPHFAFLLNFTYRYIHLDGATYSGIGLFGEGYRYSGSADLHRLGVMIGFIIN